MSATDPVDAIVAAASERQSRQRIGDARRRLAAQFRAAGLDSPDLDARVLVGHALALDHAALAAQADRELTIAEAHAIDASARRRLAREPVARIVGHKEFWGLPLALNAETLVPRPESEIVVNAALDAIGERSRAWHIADLGTGTGALLIALLSELPHARGVGTDVSLPALACAQANARAIGCGARAAFVACDYGAALRGPFDLVVSNPPYVASGDIATLEPEVRAYDPARALDGGTDGLDGHRAVAADAARLLAPGGTLVVELGASQRAAVATILAGHRLAPGAPHHDLSGVARTLTASQLP